MTKENPFQVLLDFKLPKKIMRCIADCGGEVRFCGGALRDALRDAWLGNVPDLDCIDVDMATTLPPDQARSALELAGLRVFPTGIDHGTITVLDPEGGDKVEVTTLRIDRDTDGRHAEVAFTDDWEADSCRRDFTINSLYLTEGGELIDFHGGEKDLQRGVIRFVGEADERIREDYLRILRFIRFYGAFGKTPIDGATESSLRKHKARLAGLSGERVQAEMKGIVKTGSVEAIKVMTRIGIDREIVPHGMNPNHFEAFLTIAPRSDPINRLAVMISPQDAENLVSRLRLSKQDRTQFLTINTPLTAEEKDGLMAEDWPKAAWRLARKTPLVNIVTRLEVHSAHHYPSEEIRQRAEDISGWQRPSFPVNGDDLKERGMEGRAVGKALGKLEEVWVNQGFAPSSKALLATLDEQKSEGENG